MANDTKTYMEDRESLRALVQCLPDEQLRLYDSFMALSIEAAFPGRRLVVYTLKKGRPVDVEVLTLGAMRMSAQGGPTVEVTSDVHTHPITVGMVPAKLPGKDVFLHVPQKFEFKWKGKTASTGGVNFAPHYAILVKSRSKAHLALEGDTYCVRLNTFREMFPDQRVGY